MNFLSLPSPTEALAIVSLAASGTPSTESSTPMNSSPTEQEEYTEQDLNAGRCPSELKNVGENTVVMPCQTEKLKLGFICITAQGVTGHVKESIGDTLYLCYSNIPE